MKPYAIIILLLCLLFSVSDLNAQDLDGAAAPEDSLYKTLNTWIPTLGGQIAFSRASFDNWVGGGENATTLKIGVDGTAMRSNGTLRQLHRFQFANGKTKLGDIDTRKTEDIIRYGIEAAYDTHPIFKPFLAFNLLTQLEEGFDYAVDASAQDPISSFFAPAYLNELAGVAWEPLDWLQARIGVGAKQTFVNDESFRPRYGNGIDQSVRNEGGLDFSLIGEKALMENIILKSEFNLWQTLIGDGEKSPDMRWRNALGMVVNEYVTVNLEYELFYDADQKRESVPGSGNFDEEIGLQQRQGLSVGIGLSIF